MGDVASGTKPLVARGVRNNNPGNIRISASDWVGKLPVDPRIENAFERFDTAEHGIRALTRLLKNYQQIYGLNTIDDLIDRYAPPNENNTEAYKRSVSERIGIGRKSPLGLSLLSPSVMQSLVVAIIAIECAGYAYPADVVERGVALGLGVAPPAAPEPAAPTLPPVVVPAPSGTVSTTLTSAISGAAGAVAGAGFEAGSDELTLIGGLLTLLPTAVKLFLNWRARRG